MDLCLPSVWQRFLDAWCRGQTLEQASEGLDWDSPVFVWTNDRQADREGKLIHPVALVCNMGNAELSAAVVRHHLAQPWNPRPVTQNVPQLAVPQLTPEGRIPLPPMANWGEWGVLNAALAAEAWEAASLLVEPCLKEAQAHRNTGTAMTAFGRCLGAISEAPVAVALLSQVRDACENQRVASFLTEMALSEALAADRTEVVLAIHKAFLDIPLSFGSVSLLCCRGRASAAVVLLETALGHGQTEQLVVKNAYALAKWLSDLRDQLETAPPHRPLPFNLKSLQTEMRRQIGLSSRDTLLACQSLHEKGWLSYPRTDCEHFPRATHAQCVTTLSELGRLFPELEQDARAVDRQRLGPAFNDARVVLHSALMPNLFAEQAPELSALSPMEREVLLAVTRRFLAQFQFDVLTDEALLHERERLACLHLAGWALTNVPLARDVLTKEDCEADVCEAVAALVPHLEADVLAPLVEKGNPSAKALVSWAKQQLWGDVRVQPWVQAFARQATESQKHGVLQAIVDDLYSGSSWVHHRVQKLGKSERAYAWRECLGEALGRAALDLGIDPAVAFQRHPPSAMGPGDAWAKATAEYQARHLKHHLNRAFESPVDKRRRVRM